MACKDKQQCAIYNICTGEEISIKNLITLIEKITNKKAKIFFAPENNQGGYWKGDYALAQRNLGWKSEVILEEGISKIIKTQ